MSSSNMEDTTEDSALTSACRLLEQARCQEAECEAWHYFSSHCMTNSSGDTNVASSAPRGITDAWIALAATTHKDEPSNNTNESTPAPGQYSQVIQTRVLHNSIIETAATAQEIKSQRNDDDSLAKAVDKIRKMPPDVYFQQFQQRHLALQHYHAKHNVVASKRIKTGYDLNEKIQSWVQPVQDDTVFTTAEVCGKYFDLKQQYNQILASSALCEIFIKNKKSDDAVQEETDAVEYGTTSNSSYSYIDFLQDLSLDCLDKILEAQKLQHKQVYASWLDDLFKYLTYFIERTAPLWTTELTPNKQSLLEQQVIQPALDELKESWTKLGGYPPSFEAIDSERVLAQEVGAESIIDLQAYDTVDELIKSTTADQIKLALQNFGLKAGGTPKDRAERLWLTKTTPLDEIPKKLFKTNVGTSNNATANVLTRYDLAKKQVQVTALLQAWRPTLQATMRRQERHSTQTLKEREREMHEELYTFTNSSSNNNNKELTRGDDDDDEDVDEPIYNPKNVPLDWDGKPIPYWLFKLHGLQHFYPCEICGGQAYRGRRNFELHFAESRHNLGMKALGIPNTKHFHGVTSINDAKELWSSLEEKLTQYNDTKQEEYEDSHGNVLTRAEYEDLARQGLL